MPPSEIPKAPTRCRSSLPMRMPFGSARLSLCDRECCGTGPPPAGQADPAPNRSMHGGSVQASWAPGHEQQLLVRSVGQRTDERLASSASCKLWVGARWSALSPTCCAYADDVVIPLRHRCRHDPSALTEHQKASQMRQGRIEWGRNGACMVRRFPGNGHARVAHDVQRSAVAAVAKDVAATAAWPKEMVSQPPEPLAIGLSRCMRCRSTPCGLACQVITAWLDSPSASARRG